MKKILAIILAISMLSALMAIGSSAAFGRTYTAPKGTITIDGIAEAIWDSAEWTEVDKPYDGADKADYPEVVKIKLLWDENYLYFYADVTDADINYDNDIVEIYIDEDASFGDSYDSNDSQTRFRSDGTVIADSGTNCKNDAQAVGVATATGFVIEGSLAWTGEVSIAEGSTMGLEFMYSVADATSDFVQAFRWNADTANGDAAPWQASSAWGTLTLSAAPVAETEAPVTEAPTTDASVEDTTAVETPAAQTADLMTVAAVVAVISLGAVAIANKH